MRFAPIQLNDALSTLLLIGELSPNYLHTLLASSMTVFASVTLVNISFQDAMFYYLLFLDSHWLRPISVYTWKCVSEHALLSGDESNFASKRNCSIRKSSNTDTSIYFVLDVTNAAKCYLHLWRTRFLFLRKNALKCGTTQRESSTEECTIILRLYSIENSTIEPQVLFIFEATDFPYIAWWWHYAANIWHCWDSISKRAYRKKWPFRASYCNPCILSFSAGL